MRVLLLCHYDPYNASTVCSHINAFYAHSENNVFVFTHLLNHNGNIPDDFPLYEFDVIVLHYSIFLAVDAYVSNRSRKKIKEFSGKKVIFLQDEYRFVGRSVNYIKDLGFNIIFTCVPEEAIEQVYPSALLPGVRRVNTLTGYVPEELLTYPTNALINRKYDVSYRGRKYPAWHGELGLEKWQIVDKFKKIDGYASLKTNISYDENDRLYGLKWIKLISDSKAVLGVESGASVFDISGEISSKVEVIEALLPSYNYERIKRKYFADVENKISLAQISPRVFEAIALRTACILFEGNYSGVLEPWRHYLPLKKDMSNADEILNALKDNEKIADMIACAYAEVAQNHKYSYKGFIERFDAILQEEVPEEQRRGPNPVLFEELYKVYPFYRISAPYVFGFIQTPKLKNKIREIYFKIFGNLYFLKKISKIFRRGA